MGLYLTNEGKRLLHITPEGEFWEGIKDFKFPDFSMGKSMQIAYKYLNWLKEEQNALKDRIQPEND